MSIQKQLLKLILAMVVLATFFAALQSYQQSDRELERIFDNQLAQFTHTLVALTHDKSPIEDNQHVFQIRYADGRLVQSQALIKAAKRLPRPFQAHAIQSQSQYFDTPQFERSETSQFSEAGFWGQRWRLYEKHNDAYSVLVAEPIQQRIDASENLLLSSILPIVLTIPVIGLFIFYIIQKSVQPVADLGMALKQKSHRDLSPLNTEQVPQELQLVTDKVNDLMARLDSAFDREKRLTANIAHELRTPISVLTITSHNLLQQIKTTHISESQLLELKAQVARMAQVVEQIIALSRYTPEHFEQSLTTVDLTALLQDLIGQRYEQIADNEQDISLNADNITVFGEQFALTTLFDNLLKNAIKYAGKGQTIMMQTVAAPSGFIGIEVSDSGPGVKPETLAKLTTPFYRDDTNKHQAKGSGLGLAIVQHIVTLLNGELKIAQSALGGLGVTIYLPVAKSEQASQGAKI